MPRLMKQAALTMALIKLITTVEIATLHQSATQRRLAAPNLGDLAALEVYQVQYL